jgi:hypothetical protein
MNKFDFEQGLNQDRTKVGLVAQNIFGPSVNLIEYF